MPRLKIKPLIMDGDCKKGGCDALPEPATNLANINIAGQ